MGDMSAAGSGVGVASLQGIARVPDVFPEVLCFLDVRLWASACTGCTQLRRSIVDQQTHQSFGTSFRFEKLDNHHLLLPPLLLSHVQFHKVRCLVLDEALSLTDDLSLDQQPEFLAQVTFLLVSAKDCLEVVRMSRQYW